MLKKTNMLRRPRRCSLVVVALLVTSVQLGAGGQEERQSVALGEIKQMDFLLGEWKLDTWFSTGDGNRRTGSAELFVSHTLDGQGVEFRARYPRPGGQQDFLSVATFVFSEELGKWVGSGINTLGNQKKFDVSFVEGAMVVIQSGRLFRGRPGINRTTYRKETATTFRVVQEHSPDNGVTWRAPAFGYIAQKLD